LIVCSIIFPSSLRRGPKISKWIWYCMG